MISSKGGTGKTTVAIGLAKISVENARYCPMCGGSLTTAAESILPERPRVKLREYQFELSPEEARRFINEAEEEFRRSFERHRRMSQRIDEFFRDLWQDFLR